MWRFNQLTSAVRRLVGAVGLLLATAAAAFAEMPDAPDPVELTSSPVPARSADLTRTDKFLLAGIAGARAGDVVTTTVIHRMGGREVILGQTVAGSPALLSLVEAGAVIGQAAGTKWARKHGHDKLAIASEWVHFGLVVGTVGWNAEQIQKR
jgi:hypothetical protein